MRKELLQTLWEPLSDKIKESLRSVLPVSLIVLILSLTPWVDITGRELGNFGIATLLLILGIGLFNQGADLAMTPMGQYVGEGLTSSKKMGLLLTVAFVMGLLITVAEPDLSVLASQVSTVIRGSVLMGTVGIGVGLMLLLGVIKIIFHHDLTSILMFFYMVLFCLASLLMARSDNWVLLSMCFDSGGVTTGPITVPFIMALGVGISLTVGGRNASENSFGLIALCSVGPIAAVLLLSIFSSGNPAFKVPDLSMDSIMAEGTGALILGAMGDVLKSLVFIVLFFLVLQFTVLRLPRTKLKQIFFGILYTFVGLVLFLLAVEVAFMPIGYKIGTQLSHQPALIICLAFVIGMVVVLAEPAVHVLNMQVEEITGGEVSKRQMMTALSIGVGVSIGLSVLRIYFDFSLLYYIIPGYLISLGLSFFVPKLYTAIAFDSGGVASGPLTSSFILPMVIGVCVTLQGESRVLDLAFGVVAMVAMTPLITIQSLGFKSVITTRRRRQAAMRRILASAEEDPIIYFD